MLLYESKVSGNCWKVRRVLAELDLPYESVELSVTDRSDRADRIGGLNPALRVPTLVLDDGRPLAESNAIMLYLADGTPLVPVEPYERAVMLQWLFYEQYDHEPAIAVARFLRSYAPQPDPEALAAAQARGARVLATMEAHLATRTFFVAERFTLADIALYAYTHVADEGGFDLPAYPAIGAWLERVAAQPRHIGLAD